MSKLTLTGLALPLFLLFASPQASAPKAFGGNEKLSESQGHSGTLQKMIVENGSVTMDLDLNRLNGISFAPVRPTELQFTVAANSFFTILVFNDLLRGPDSGSMALMPRSQAVSALPCVISWLTQPARNRKTSLGRSVRFGRARQQDGIHVFQCRRRPVRL